MADMFGVYDAAQKKEEEERQRRENGKRCWEYYLGEHDASLTTRQGQPDDNVVINLARYIVDKSATFLFGKDVGMELAEGETTPEEEWLQDVWRANRKMSFLHNCAVEGGIFGHLFVKILPDDPETGLPRMVNIAPEYVTVTWDDEDISRVLRYRIEWATTDHAGRTIYRRQDMTNEGTAWYIENLVARAHGRWEQDPERPSVRWPYLWAPMVDCQNLPLPGAYYGLSDLADLALQDTVNYVASKINRILRYHAHPKTVAKGMGSGDIRVTEDEVLVLPGEAAELYNLEMQSDLSAALAFFDRMRTEMLEVSRTPRVDPATVNIGALSGFALRVLHGDLLEKTETKRRLYGDLLIELNRRLLDLNGYGSDNYTTLHWQDPLPVDEAAEQQRDAFELDYNLVSHETVQRRRELDPEIENERIGAEEVAEGNVGAALLREFVRGGE